MREYICELIDPKYEMEWAPKEEVVRCRDCRHFKPGEEKPPVDWCCYFHDEVTPLGFCAWGNKTEFVTCKCGEDIERIGRIQTCPSCGRKVIA